MSQMVDRIKAAVNAEIDRRAAEIDADAALTEINLTARIDTENDAVYEVVWRKESRRRLLGAKRR